MKIATTATSNDSLDQHLLEHDSESATRVGSVPDELHRLPESTTSEKPNETTVDLVMGSGELVIYLRKSVETFMPMDPMRVPTPRRKLRSNKCAIAQSFAMSHPG